ncbi:serine-rich adhesin for platelets-like [Anopheles aquasalis]|uniref:serine-rich adhesin for platelets-like n=1 Tax=Anopheles aquasalis TaxID=42839 RepID=UPI00215B078E|nr:serine-rich adhesin for platelets-like [Anopheles aquasalis]
MSGDCKMIGEGSLATLKGKPWHAFIESSGNRSIFDTEDDDCGEAISIVGEHGQRLAQGIAITGQQSHHPQKQQSLPGSSGILAGSATDRGTIQSRPRGSVMRLDRADMGLYGICPETDPFYAVICDICESVVKPQGLQKHMSNRHHSHYHHAAKLNANGNTSSSTTASGALASGSTVTAGSAGNGNANAGSAGSGNRSIANDQQLLTGTVYVSSGEKTDYRSNSAAETISRTDASKLSSSLSSSSGSSSFSGPTAGTSSTGRFGRQEESDAGGANLEPGSLAVPQPAKVRSSGSGKTKSKNAKSTHSSKSSSGTAGYASSGTLSSSFAKASIVAPASDGVSTINIPLADFGGAIGSSGVPVVLMSNCSVVPDKKATFPIASDGSTGTSTKSLSTKRASKQTSSSSSSSSPSSSSSSSSSYSSSNSSNSTSSSSHSSSSSSSNSFSSSNAAAQHKFSSEKKSERSRDFDPDRHCGVATPDGKRHCTKPLTSCKSHSLSQRRAVSGRSKHLDKLIAELRTPGVSKELENTSGSSGVFLEVIESSSNSSTSFDAADRRMAASGSSSAGTGGTGGGETVVRSKTPSTVSSTDSSAHGGRTSTDGMAKLLHAPGHRSGSPASHKTGTSGEGKSERSKHKQSSRSSHGGTDRGGSTTGSSGQSHSTNKSSSHHRSGSSTKHGAPTRDSSSGSGVAVTTTATIAPQQPPPTMVTSQASQQAMLQSTGQQHQQLLQQPPTVMPQQQSLLLANAPTEMLAQHYALGESTNTVLADHTTIMMDPGSNLLKLAVSPGTVETGDGSHQQYTASGGANVNMMQDQLTVTLPLSVINSMNLSGTSLVNMAHGCGDGSLAPNASSGVHPNAGPTATTLLTTGVDTVEPQHTAEAFIPAELIEQLPLVAANGTDPNTAYRLAATGNAGTGMGGTTITAGGVTVDDGGLADLATLPNFNEQINYTLQTVLAQNLQSAEGTAELVDSIDDIVPTISLLPSAANPLVIPQLQGELGDSIILTPTQLTTLSQSLVDQHFIDNMTLKSAEMEIGLTVNGPVDIPSKLMLLRKVDEEFVRERQQQQQSALPYQARAGQMLDDMRGIRMWYSGLPKPLHVNTFQLRRLAGGFVMNRKLLALRKNLLTEASLLGAGVTGAGSTGANQQQNNSPGATVVGRSASGSGDILLSSLSSIGKSKLGGIGEGAAGVVGAGAGTNGTVGGIGVGSPMMGSPTGSGGGIGIRSGNTAPVNRAQRRMLIAQPRSGAFAGERAEKPSCLLSNTYFRNLITSMQQQQQPVANNAKEGMTLPADTNSIDRLHSLKRSASSLTTLSNKRLKIINNLHTSTAPPQMLLQGSSCKMKPKVL